MSAPYVYDDAHGHRLTVAPVSNTLDQRYVSLTAECMDIGGDMANVWLPMPDVNRLAVALAGRVPFEHADHMGDTVTVAPAVDWTTFTVVRAGRDDDEAPVTVRVVVLTARLPQVAHGIQSVELAAAVAEQGAFPVSVGPESQPPSADRLAEIRSLDLLALMDDRAAPVISGHLAVLLAEVDRLEAQRDRRRARLVALQNDALNVRGALSPNGEDRKVPFPLGPTLLPAVEWLIGRVAELEHTVQQMVEGLNGHDCPPPGELPMQAVTRFAVRLMEAERLLAEDGRSCPPADHPHQVGCPLDVPLPVAVPDGPTRLFPTVGWLREDPHDSPLHHDYRVGHDLPKLGGAS